MRKPKISTAWLSAEMAHALAAVCPPLKTADVVQAADSLTAHAKSTCVIGHLLLHAADLMLVRRVVRLYLRCVALLVDDNLGSYRCLHAFSVGTYGPVVGAVWT